MRRPWRLPAGRIIPSTVLSGESTLDRTFALETRARHLVIKSERLQKGEEIWLRLPRLCADWLDSGMLPEALRRVTLQLQVLPDSVRWSPRQRELIANLAQLGERL